MPECLLFTSVPMVMCVLPLFTSERDKCKKGQISYNANTPSPAPLGVACDWLAHEHPQTKLNL